MINMQDHYECIRALDTTNNDTRSAVAALDRIHIHHICRCGRDCMPAEQTDRHPLVTQTRTTPCDEAECSAGYLVVFGRL